MKNNFFTLDPLFLFKLISLPFIIFLFYKTNKIYIGENFYYIFFSITSISYLFLALSYKISFFHIFMSLFLFLGFWFKFSLNTIINYSNQNNYYAEGTGNFDFKSNSLDEVIMISTLSILSFMFGMIVIYFPRIKNKLKKNLFISKNFIAKIIFFTLAPLICLLNFKFEVYIKGLVSVQSSNFLIYNFFAWFYQVGSLMAISYLFDLELKKEKFASLMFLIIVYLFIFSLSLNSRNYIFFLLPFFISVYFYSKQNNMKFESKFIFYLLSLISILLFLLSIGLSHTYRMNNYSFPTIEYNNKVEKKKKFI